MSEPQKIKARQRISRADGVSQDRMLMLMPRIDTPIKVDDDRAGAILPFVLRQRLA